MVATNSTMLELGTHLPDFDLYSPLQDRNYSFDDFRGSPLLVIFMCNHCPYVKYILDGLSKFARTYTPKGIQIVAINPNDIDSYPADGPEQMIKVSQHYDLNFPYLIDHTQNVAKDFKAVCTPEFFLFGKNEKLVYRGQFDSSRPRNDIAVTGEDVGNACDRLLAGMEPDRDQIPSIGCSIKWRPGATPKYAA